MAENIKIFLIKSFAYTPFTNEDDLKYLSQNGIYITKNLNEADVLVSQNLKHLKKYFWRYFQTKKYLVWTFEPRFDINFNSKRKLMFGAITCHFMNVYTKNVFTSGLTFHAHYIDKKLIPLKDNFNLTNKRVVALISFFNGTSAPLLERNGINIDLIKLRTDIALAGYHRGVLDIYGKGWPENISSEDSREGNWKGRKFEILENYNFNLCFENTIAANYITEKIWDSIGSYCLPIYFGKGNDIYKLFPKDSFLDYSDFNSPLELFTYIENMSEKEFVNRLNKCIKVYNNISQQEGAFVWEKRKESLDAIVDNLKRMKR